MLKTFALRGREVPITIYGPPGLRDLFGVAAADLRAGSPTRSSSRSCAPATTLDRDDYRLSTFPVAHGVSSIGYALVEDERPGRFDVEAADALGVPSGPGARRAAARRVGDARRRDDDHPGRGARAGAARAQGRDRRRHGAGRVRDRGRADADVLVHEATFCEDERERARRDAALDGATRRPGSRATPRSSCSRSRTSRTATSAARSRARRGRSSRTRSCRRTSIRSTSASRSAAGRCW